MGYSKKHTDRINRHTELKNSDQFSFEPISLGETEIDISGKVCKVAISRSKDGNIQIEPIEDGIFNGDGWLSNGHTTEGYNSDIIVGQFNN